MLHYCEIKVWRNINSHRSTIKKSWNFSYLTLIYKKFSNLVNTTWNFYHFVFLKILQSSINCTNWNACFFSNLDSSFSFWYNSRYNAHTEMIRHYLEENLLPLRIRYQGCRCRNLQYKTTIKTTINEILLFICANYFRLKIHNIRFLLTI